MTAIPCKGLDCEKPAGTLQCPSCLKLGIAGSFFCSQDCFKKSWGTHKIIHNVGNGPAGTYDPFPNFQYKGDLKACYPIGKMDKVPEGIQKPDYADTSIPRSEQLVARSTKMKTLDEKEIEGMRTVCRLGREVLDIAAAALRPGITTDEINTVVHNACLERNSYPSPLNYYEFPKSVCTSVNEIICHGIPDKRPLKDGDIVNLDVTLYHNGFHGDLNETYYVGDKAKADKESVNIVETARECLEKALALVKPGMPFRDYGITIEAHAKANNCSVVRTYCGHGINQLFHCAPNIPHYAKNKAIGVAKPGMCFTIEPMISGGDWRDVTWPDNWTSSTIDGKRSAQFEHTILVTETGCEILTARKADSPGGPVKRID